MHLKLHQTKGKKLLIFEEETPCRVVPLPQRKSLHTCNIGSGDILVFQL